MIRKAPVGVVFFSIAMLMLSVVSICRAGSLEIFHNVALTASDSNDGDSFHVMAGGRHLLVRLYFVDCPETSALATSDARRLSEQMRYFGLPSVVEAVSFGKAAAAFTARVLSAPFTLYTTFASAPGRSSIPRIYGFIETAGGDDLASLLVKNGLARPFGVRRETPEGVAHDEMSQRLKDMEASAMLKRAGIWARSDPDRIAELRAAQRAEDRKLSDIQQQVRVQETPQKRIDINTASAEQLAAIKGIGPSLAAEIISGRPYRSVDALTKVKGIGPATLTALRPLLYVTP
ncbi:MAG: helix-hairpin-helix domain-containing protein [Pseudomonadota bacterium]